MPNWCSNKTYVFGKTDNVKDFINPVLEYQEQSNDFRGFMHYYYPVPEELMGYSSFISDFENPIHPNWAVMLEKGEITQEWHDELCKDAIEKAALAKSNLEKHGYTGWYDWCISNWGSKWGDCDLDIDITHRHDDTSEIVLRYETAWCPILEGLTYLSEKFPRLIFSTFYVEEGMGFQGYHKVAGGDVMDDMSGEYIPSADDYHYIMDGMDEQQLTKIIEEGV